MTTKKPNIQIDTARQFQVSGELKFTTIADLWSLGNQMISNHARAVFDFSGVTYVDSSGLALLTAWAKEARRLNRPIKFLNVPNKLHTIAELSGFSEAMKQWIN